MKILGIGNAIVDVICKINDKFLIEIKFHGDGKALKAAVKKTDVLEVNIIDQKESK